MSRVLSLLCTLVLIVVATSTVDAAGCGNYTSCKSCASASPSLSCGWCAGTGSCTAGTAAGPSNNATCGVGGWGFQGDACTQQAQCNTMSGTDCTTCVQSAAGQCGYCQSTGRCETGNSTAAFDGDCDSSLWSFSTATCPAVYDECNAYNPSCGQCESAPYFLNCGYCSLTNTCSTGNPDGPTAGGASCTPANWTFQSCPTDYLCDRQTTCGGCQVQTACVWCMSTNVCMAGETAPIPGQTCGTWVGREQICPGAPPSPGPSPSGGGDGKPYPTEGAVAIATLVAFSLSALLRFFLYFCLQRWKPVLGSRIMGGVVVRDWQTPLMRAVPLMVAVCAIALKLPAMAVNTWDYHVLKIYSSDAGSVSYGLLSVHTEMDGYGSTTVSYAALCRAASDSDNGTGMCRTLRAAGIMTLIGGVMSVAASAGFIVLALLVAFRRGALAAYGVSMWRLQGLAHLGAMLSVCVWIASAHTIIRYSDDRSVVGASWFLFMAAWIVDLVLLVVIRRAVMSTPNPAQQQPYQNLEAAPVAVRAFVPYQAGPMGQQQQPLVQVAHAAPIYGAPQQQQQLQQLQQQQANAYPPQHAHAMPPPYAPPQPRI